MTSCRDPRQGPGQSLLLPCCREADGTLEMFTQISGPGLLPVTPHVQQILDLCFDSVYALFGFSINVTVTAALSAPVFPLTASSSPGACTAWHGMSCNSAASVQDLLVISVSAPSCVPHEFRVSCSSAGSVGRQPGVSAQPPPAAGAKRARQLLQSAPHYNASAAARYEAVRPLH
jgi:hypothetical protein